MDNLFFSWDERKARANKRRHGVSFEEASTVFTDENARLIHDSEHSDEEDRFILLGFSAKARVVTVVHAYRLDDSEIRIISARKADRHEREQYGSFL